MIRVTVNNYFVTHPSIIDTLTMMTPHVPLFILSHSRSSNFKHNLFNDLFINTLKSLLVVNCSLQLLFMLLSITNIKITFKDERKAFENVGYLFLLLKRLSGGGLMINRGNVTQPSFVPLCVFRFS